MIEYHRNICSTYCFVVCSFERIKCDIKLTIKGLTEQIKTVGNVLTSRSTTQKILNKRTRVIYVTFYFAEFLVVIVEQWHSCVH